MYVIRDFLKNLRDGNPLCPPLKVYMDSSWGLNYISSFPGYWYPTWKENIQYHIPFCLLLIF